jgi:hypothetical protein
MKSTTLENLNGATDCSELRDYLGKVNITAQATWDRWPEANGMRSHLYHTGMKAGLSPEQIGFDLDHANIDCTGGRW